MHEDVRAFVNVAYADRSVEQREDIIYKLEDIIVRAVKPELIASYCKSLGWEDLTDSYCAYVQSLEVEKVADSLTAGDQNTEEAVAHAVRAILEQLYEAAYEAPETGLSISYLYSQVSEALIHKDQQQSSGQEVSLAINNLLVDILRVAGHDDSELSEMSLSTMAETVRSHVEFYRKSMELFKSYGR